MKIHQVAKIAVGQDGAIWGKYLFRFDANGDAYVYNLDSVQIDRESEQPLQEIAKFKLDRAEEIVPHSNAVVFGNEYFCEEDEFPLLYSNIYNNCATAPDPMKGTCCVYRLTRQGNEFTTKLVQLIRVGFTEDAALWCSSAQQEDVRPYGNFVIDCEKGIYYGFTMRDACNSTRYLSFKLPKLQDGQWNEQYGVRQVILTPEDILDQFDCEYHRFLQGACAHQGKIYSVEGFTAHTENPPAVRVINPKEKRQECYIKFEDYVPALESEWIDFREDICFYADNAGNLYVIDWETI